MVKNIFFTLLFVVVMVGCSDDGEVIEIIPDVRKTFIPDDSFETALIELGYDDILDDSVMTKDIELINELDVSNRKVGIGNLTGIEDFVSLTYLNCGANAISELNVSNLTQLKYLWCYNNIDLNDIDVTKNDSLETLVCFSNHIFQIDVTNNIKLKRLGIQSNMIEQIDLTQNLELIILHISRNNISEIDLSKNRKLRAFSIGGGGNIVGSDPIKNLDLSRNPLLKDIHITDSYLEELNLKNGGNIFQLHVNLSNNIYLNCIQVDNDQKADSNGIYENWQLDEGVILSKDCDY